MVFQTYSNDSRFFWRCSGVSAAAEPVAASLLLWPHPNDEGTRSQAESKVPLVRRVDVDLGRFIPQALLFFGSPRISEGNLVVVQCPLLHITDAVGLNPVNEELRVIDLAQVLAQERI